MSAKQFKIKNKYEENVPRCGTCKTFVASNKVPGQPVTRCAKGGMNVSPFAVCDAWVDRRNGDTIDPRKK
jgi:hypothetical protein